MKKIKISLLILLICSLHSCNIDLEPESQISVNSFWKTEQDALGGLYGMYTQFRTFTNSEYILLGEARSEIMGHALANADYRIKYFENSMIESNADRNWKQLYKIVNFANLIIKYVPEISFVNEKEKNSFLAQAYSMRAFVYFVMVRTWGALPLIDQPVESYEPDLIYKERTSASEIFSFIKSDIEAAYGLFSDNSYNSSRSIWSKPALNMLKAEVYLWTGKVAGGGNGDITLALNALEEAENSDLELLNDYKSVFSYSNKGNKEIILAVHYENLEASNNYFGDTYIAGVDPRMPATEIEKIGAVGGNNWWAPTTLFRNQFDNEDTRKDASFMEIHTQADGKLSYYTSIVLKCRGFEESGVRKFLDDIVIYRYADLLLMKAEAKNALGQDPSSEINKVRQRAFGANFGEHTFTAGSQNDNDEAILRERLFELAFEGKRWWDLVRFNKAFEKVPSLAGRESDQYLLLWPLTLETLSLSSKIEQNPGY